MMIGSKNSQRDLPMPRPSPELLHAPAGMSNARMVGRWVARARVGKHASEVSNNDAGKFLNSRLLFNRHAADRAPAMRSNERKEHNAERAQDDPQRDFVELHHGRRSLKSFAASSRWALSSEEMSGGFNQLSRPLGSNRRRSTIPARKRDTNAAPIRRGHEFNLVGVKHDRATILDI